MFVIFVSKESNFAKKKKRYRLFLDIESNYHSLTNALKSRFHFIGCQFISPSVSNDIFVCIYKETSFKTPNFNFP